MGTRTPSGHEHHQTMGTRPRSDHQTITYSHAIRGSWMGLEKRLAGGLVESLPSGRRPHLSTLLSLQSCFTLLPPNRWWSEWQRTLAQLHAVVQGHAANLISYWLLSTWLQGATPAWHEQRRCMTQRGAWHREVHGTEGAWHREVHGTKRDMRRGGARHERCASDRARAIPWPRLELQTP